MSAFELLIMLFVGIYFAIFFCDRKGRLLKRRKCRDGCDPKNFVTIWSDGTSRKSKCSKCDWVHHVRGVRVSDDD